MIRLIPTVLLVSILSGGYASPCLAQDTSQRASDAEARALFEAGREAFAAAEYERALEYFQRAYELSGRAVLLYNIAQSADRARQDAVALDAYVRFIEEVAESPYRAQAETRIEFLRAQAARQAEEAAQTEAEPEVVAEPEPADAPEVLAPAPSPVDASEGPSRVGPLLVVGVGAAAAVTGGILLGLGQSARGSVEDAPVGTRWSDVSGDYESAATLGTAGVAALAVGVVAAGAGVTWLVVSGNDDDSPVEVTAGLQGLVVRGSF